MFKILALTLSLASLQAVSLTRPGPGPRPYPGPADRDFPVIQRELQNAERAASMYRFLDADLSLRTVQTRSQNIPEQAGKQNFLQSVGLARLAISRQNLPPRQRLDQIMRNINQAQRILSGLDERRDQGQGLIYDQAYQFVEKAMNAFRNKRKERSEKRFIKALGQLKNIKRNDRLIDQAEDAITQSLLVLNNEKIKRAEKLSRLERLTGIAKQNISESKRRQGLGRINPVN